MAAINLPPGLMFVHGNHPEDLRDLVVAWIKRYPLKPLDKEIILVQNNGIAQWLKLALAANPDADNGGGCGIAAALSMSLPASFLWRMYRAVLGYEAVPESSPFDKQRLVWRLMRLLAEPKTHTLFNHTRHFLENDHDGRKCFQLAERIADIFDQYQVYRSDWLAAWTRGDDVLIDARGHRFPIPLEQHWQAILWRMLLADVEQDYLDPFSQKSLGHFGRAMIHAAFMRRAADWGNDKRPANLPTRVCVFGISTLPRQSLEVLGILARWTQILMCVHNPCEHYWADIIADKDLLRARQQRRISTPTVLSDEDLHQHAHPLLAMWGKQGRDFIGLLDEYDSMENRDSYLPRFTAIQQRINLFTKNSNTTLLQQLQDDIRDLRPLPETRNHWPAVDASQDISIRFQITHSPQREMEVLHDQLLAAFNADPTLQPRDVMIMLPDIDSYAPHIQSVFGLYAIQDPRFIPFSLVDRGRHHVDRLLNALQKLIKLPQSRMTVSEVFNLLDVPALRRRFAIAKEDLPLLRHWIIESNIRWGLHSEHRESFGLPEQSQNTWLFGRRRMLLGYAVGIDASAWQEIEPYDEIGGLDAAALGPLVQLLDSLEMTWRIFSTPATVAEWCLRLRALMADFFIADNHDDANTLLQLETALQNWQEDCNQARLTEILPISVVGDYWLSQIDNNSLTQRFFAGTVTFATLMPMRAIPFRQIYLLGMNDGDYPRTQIPMEFDLMGNHYRPGDRLRREDDRYLFLEALLSARERLYISWVGRSVNDNSPRPPSVLVSQLRNHLEAGWRLSESVSKPDAIIPDLLAAITVEHHLQPFSPAYYPVHPHHSSLFTYALEWLPADLSTTAPLSNPVLAPLVREEPLSFRELTEFLKYPVKAFFRQRLGVTLDINESTITDHEPFELDGLEKWKLQDELIREQKVALIHNEEIATACTNQLARIRGRGVVAWSEFGKAMAHDLAEPLADLFIRYQHALGRWPHLIDSEKQIQFTMKLAGQNLEIADWLGNFRKNENNEYGQVVLEPSALHKNNEYQYHKLIGHWITHLLACVITPTTTEIISKKGDIKFQPLTSAATQAYLTTLLTAWWRGMRQPLPLATTTAFKWLISMDIEKSRMIYDGDDFVNGEVTNSAYLQRVYPDFDAIFHSESGEFTKLAETLLRPLFIAAQPYNAITGAVVCNSL